VTPTTPVWFFSGSSVELPAGSIEPNSAGELARRLRRRDVDQPLWSDGLTGEQAVAASRTGSHARLLAGPGTGKMHTLARRVVYLVTQEHVPPSEILVLTFTRMAARDVN
jgi:hypothetical protein